MIIGAPRILRKNGDPTIWTGLIIVNDKGLIENFYDKVHLVPFGEFVPFRKLFPFLFNKITPGAIDYTAGDALKTLYIKDFPPLSPLICYEGIFPDHVVAKDVHTHQKSAKWMLNLTNDAWFGRSSGPYQHLAMTRVRAIEEGLPLIRVANNGISAVIDPCGRIVKSLGLNVKGIIDCTLPKALDQATLFARFGNKVFFLMLLSMALVIVYLSLKRNKTE